METITPEPLPQKSFTDPEAAWAYIAEIYRRNTGFIRGHLLGLTKGIVPGGRVQAYYPEVQVTSRSYGKTDSTLAYGYLHTPGIYRTTITAPDLFRKYLLEQFRVILANHGGVIEVGESDIRIPLHFAISPTERIDGDAIKKIPSGDVPVQADGQPAAGGDLMTTETFEDFELTFDWKVSEGGNSGIKYNVSEELSISEPPASAALGFEYQILDDDRHPDANAGVDGNRKAAGLYDLISPGDAKPINPPGEWNHGRIVFQGNHGEHWLNGEKVVEYDLGSARMDSLLAASKYANIAGFADRRDGHIVLQDHNDAVWFRNLKIRRID